MSVSTQSKIVTMVENDVGWLTLNNPSKHNAIDLEMWAGISDAMNAFAGNDAVRVAVIQGAGGKAFSTGADISEFHDRLDDQPFQDEYDRQMEVGLEALSRFAKPLIGSIHGYCVGGGFYLALACDVRFATAESSFAITGAKLGIAYSHTIISGLVDVVGPANTADIMLTSRHVRGEEAKAMGLVNFMVTPDELEERVRDYAQRIAGNAPLAVRATKEAIAECRKDRASRDLDLFARRIAECNNSADAQEGMRAFMERRTPHFRGM